MNYSDDVNFWFEALQRAHHQIESFYQKLVSNKFDAINFLISLRRTSSPYDTNQNSYVQVVFAKSSTCHNFRFCKLCAFLNVRQTDIKNYKRLQ